MYTKILPTLAIAALVAGCSSTPEVQTGDNAEVIEGTSLHKVDNSRVQMSYIDPDADLSKYNRVLVRPLGVDKVEIIQPSKTTSIAGRRDWVLTDKDKQALQTVFHEVMVKPPYSWRLGDQADLPAGHERMNFRKGEEYCTVDLRRKDSRPSETPLVLITIRVNYE